MIDAKMGRPRGPKPAKRVKTKKNSSTSDREALILGRPPRLAPRTDAASLSKAMDLSMRLRRAVLPGAGEITIAEMPEIMSTLACHSDLWERVALLSLQLLGHGALRRRDAELAALRVSWLCQAPYEWGEHVAQGKSAGLTEKEIARLVIGSSARGWSVRDRAILRAVEELHDTAMISDKTWKVLVVEFDDAQLFELLVLAGQFTLVAYFQNALRLRLPPGNLGLRAR